MDLIFPGWRISIPQASTSREYFLPAPAKLSHEKYIKGSVPLKADAKLKVDYFNLRKELQRESLCTFTVAEMFLAMQTGELVCAVRLTMICWCPF